MRRLLAPLSRWLDRRIDARIAAETEYLRLCIEVLNARTVVRGNIDLECQIAGARRVGDHAVADLLQARLSSPSASALCRAEA